MCLSEEKGNIYEMQIPMPKKIAHPYHMPYSLIPLQIPMPKYKALFLYNDLSESPSFDPYSSVRLIL